MTAREPDITAEAISAAEQIAYARLWNAVAAELSAFCARRDLDSPYFSERNRVAAAVWHRLHPDSALGRPENNGGSDA